MQSTAQIAEVLEDMPFMFVPEEPMSLELHEPHSHAEHEGHSDLEVNEPAEDIAIMVQDLPGVKELDPAREQDLEVRDDGNDTVGSNKTMHAEDKKHDPWDVESLLAKEGPEALYAWTQHTLDSVPRHSGYDKAGLLRAVGFLEKMIDTLSKAMRADLDGKLDADKMENIFAKIEDGIERIHTRIDKLTSTKKKKRKSKKADLDTSLVKEAQKIPGVGAIVIMVPLFISRLARTCINGMVSAGHDLNDSYAQLCDKWDLSEREKAELAQLINDMGYPSISNRGLIADKDDFNKQKGEFDYASNYVG
jgi:hypothetical protein